MKRSVFFVSLVAFILALSLNAYSAVLINEVLANGINDPDSEWVELFNNESLAANITNWKISETSSSNFTLNTIVPANGFIVLAANFEIFNLTYPNVALSGVQVINITVANFNLADTSGEVNLYNSSGALADAVAYAQQSGKAFENVSIGRYPDGSPKTFNLSTLTPGAKNDNQAPMLNKWLKPSGNNTKASAILNITVNITDDTTEIAAIVSFNSTNFSMTRYNDIFSFLWNTSLNANKQYNITVFFNDSYGKSGFNTLLNISVNNSPFIVSFSPSSLIQTISENSTLSFSVNASDPDDELLNFSWFLDNLLNSTSISNFSYSPGFNDNATHAVNVTVRDKALNEVSLKWIINVANLNRAPILDVILDKAVSKNNNLSFNITATDPDNDLLTFFSNHSGISVSKINNSRATVSWKPTNIDLGNNTVKFTVSDGFANDSKVATISVDAAGNAAPAINSIPPKTARVNEAYIYKVNATDADNDILGFSLGSNLSGISINSLSGLINVTPSTVGFFSINVSATDFAETAQQSYNLTIFGSKPIIASFSPSNLTQILSENSTLAFSINISDPDNMLQDILWFLDGAPKSINSTNFSYTPSFGENGTHNVNVTIRDVLAEESSLKWAVTVKDFNRAPVLDAIQDKAAFKNVELRFNITATDLDNDTLLFSSNKPAISVTKFSNSIATVSWKPTNLDLGITTVTFTVSDSSLTDSETITINIGFIENSAPSITSTPLTTATRDDFYSYDVNAIDADNDTLVFSLKTNATGMGISSSSGLITFTPSSVGLFSVNISATDLIETANQSYELAVSVGNRLRIDDVDAEVDGKKSSNLAQNSKISKEAKPSSEVVLKITVKNNFLETDDIEIEDIEVKTTIEGIDNGEDLEEESAEFDLDEQDDKTVKLKFKLPLNIDEDEYDVVIEAKGEDKNGNLYESEYNVELEVEKEKHDLRFLRFDVSPVAVSCSRLLNANSKIINIGQEDEENAILEIKNNDLGLSFVQRDVAINEGTEDNTFSKSLNIKISDKAENGAYPITANIYSDDGKLKDTKTVEIKVVDCIKTKQAKDDVVLILGTEKTGSTETIKKPIQINQVKVSSGEAQRNKKLLLLSTLVFTTFFVFTAIVLFIRFY